MDDVPYFLLGKSSFDHEPEIAEAKTFEVGVGRVAIVVKVQVQSQFQVLHQAVPDITEDGVRR